MLLVLITGCRPKEAAYVVWHRAVKANAYIVKHMSHALQAFVPASVTKTHHDYMWPLPDEYDAVAQRILANDVSGFENYDQLHRSLQNFYKTQVLDKAENAVIKHSDVSYYCMRTARAYRATEWVKLVTEYRLMKWTPEPLNPLQHKKMEMTLERYSAKDQDQAWNVQMRCVEKYATDPSKYQDWMAPYVQKMKASQPSKRGSH